MKKICRVLALIIVFSAGGVVRADDDVKFEFHGIIGTSTYYQSTPNFLLNGQGPLLVTSQSKQAPTFGADARETRLSFAAIGHSIMNGATPRGFVEADFFGMNSPGSYGEVSVVPRLRLAFAELSWDHTIVRAGQDWQLLNANAPLTLGHIAFPFYSAGFIGWREPGMGVFHTLDLGESKIEIAGQVLKSDWQSPYDFGLSTTNDKNVDFGQLSGEPGLEARVKWTKDAHQAYIVAHWNHVASSQAPQLTNTGADTITASATSLRDFDVLAVKVGGKTKIANVTIQGEVYNGQNLGPLLGDLLQFPITNDVHEMGGWLQAGYSITEQWSTWGSFGTSRGRILAMPQVPSKLV